MNNHPNNTTTTNNHHYGVPAPYPPQLQPHGQQRAVLPGAVPLPPRPLPPGPEAPNSSHSPYPLHAASFNFLNHVSNAPIPLCSGTGQHPRLATMNDARIIMADILRADELTTHVWVVTADGMHHQAMHPLTPMTDVVGNDEWLHDGRGRLVLRVYVEPLHLPPPSALCPACSKAQAILGFLRNDESFRYRREKLTRLVALETDQMSPEEAARKGPKILQAYRTLLTNSAVGALKVVEDPCMGHNGMDHGSRQTHMLFWRARWTEVWIRGHTAEPVPPCDYYANQYFVYARQQRQQQLQLRRDYGYVSAQAHDEDHEEAYAAAYEDVGHHGAYDAPADDGEHGHVVAADTAGHGSHDAATADGPVDGGARFRSTGGYGGGPIEQSTVAGTAEGGGYDCDAGAAASLGTEGRSPSAGSVGLPDDLDVTVAACTVTVEPHAATADGDDATDDDVNVVDAAADADEDDEPARSAVDAVLSTVLGEDDDEGVDTGSGNHEPAADGEAAAARAAELRAPVGSHTPSPPRAIAAAQTDPPTAPRVLRPCTPQTPASPSGRDASPSKDAHSSGSTPNSGGSSPKPSTVSATHAEVVGPALDVSTEADAAIAASIGFHEASSTHDADAALETVGAASAAAADDGDDASVSTAHDHRVVPSAAAHAGAAGDSTTNSLCQGEEVKSTEAPKKAAASKATKDDAATKARERKAQQRKQQEQERKAVEKKKAEQKAKAAKTKAAKAKAEEDVLLAEAEAEAKKAEKEKEAAKIAARAEAEAEEKATAVLLAASFQASSPPLTPPEGGHVGTALATSIDAIEHANDFFARVFFGGEGPFRLPPRAVRARFCSQWATAGPPVAAALCALNDYEGSEEITRMFRDRRGKEPYDRAPFLVRRAAGYLQMVVARSPLHDVQQRLRSALDLLLLATCVIDDVLSLTDGNVYSPRPHWWADGGSFTVARALLAHASQLLAQATAAVDDTVGFRRLRSTLRLVERAFLGPSAFVAMVLHCAAAVVDIHVPYHDVVGTTIRRSLRSAHDCDVLPATLAAIQFVATTHEGRAFEAAAWQCQPWHPAIADAVQRIVRHFGTISCVIAREQFSRLVVDRPNDAAPTPAARKLRVKMSFDVDDDILVDDDGGDDEEEEEDPADEDGAATANSDNPVALERAATPDSGVLNASGSTTTAPRTAKLNEEALSNDRSFPEVAVASNIWPLVPGGMLAVAGATPAEGRA